MKIEYAENVTVAVRQYVPRAIVRHGDDVLINRNHPHAAELMEIARDLVDNVKCLNDDDDKGIKLLDRVEELAGLDAAFDLRCAWLDHRAKIRLKAAARRARVWFSVWRSNDAEENPDFDDDMVDALYFFGKAAFENGGLRAVYCYAYQQGYKDALAGKAVTA